MVDRIPDCPTDDGVGVHGDHTVGVDSRFRTTGLERETTRRETTIECRDVLGTVCLASRIRVERAWSKRAQLDPGRSTTLLWDQRDNATTALVVDTARTAW